MTMDDWYDWDNQHDMDHLDGWHNSHGKVQVQVQLVLMLGYRLYRLYRLQEYVAVELI